jgi:hypothetical protein
VLSRFARIEMGVCYAEHSTMKTSNASNLLPTVHIKGDLGATEEHEGIEQSKEMRNTTLPERTRQTSNKKTLPTGEGEIKKRSRCEDSSPTRSCFFLRGQQREKKKNCW